MSYFQGRRLRFYRNITLILKKNKKIEAEGAFFISMMDLFGYILLGVFRQRFKSLCCLMLQVFALPVLRICCERGGPWASRL